ncbi:hypothetical protein M1M41_gp083 [Halorubrum sodomense tailed virus 4]|uniref:Uncharacterized protein n=1 Tax=Halorubrum sodomense tailed virus 4 TaxID=2878013 RepID=A0AAE8XXL8_9CAUD|nr:hypothetical protein M1M41_gp083 [Halorubrum sodomense tailed virus 4]UBF19368.1 hypothetical protein HRTV-19_gp42 [Halorubrum virus HRTV-19]UBF19497.1 hypothetical protein HRTV-23_gp42 [Halorubrum virus HRTV-23]UBF19750.1 hypothetical protein HRTV-18_gp41 [Halorubrum virus HRTV-18]UBF19873.1 hypothetical protein HRTV-20_gp41 [Halorubrum virus HRTV-20]UBF19997.1 hypothetical protein HRTV-22_gp42 [Halorubrum virus HRTV-22]UBF20123.1 hypothetical protein HRTV-26_gp42 [Halorubrum virus HRTV-2
MSDSECVVCGEPVKFPLTQSTCSPECRHEFLNTMADYVTAFPNHTDGQYQKAKAYLD